MATNRECYPYVAVASRRPDPDRLALELKVLVEPWQILWQIPDWHRQLGHSWDNDDRKTGFGGGIGSTLIGTLEDETTLNRLLSNERRESRGVYTVPITSDSPHRSRRWPCQKKKKGPGLSFGGGFAPSRKWDYTSPRPIRTDPA